MKSRSFPYSRHVVYPWEFVALIALSVLMLLSVGAFYVPGVVNGPQWGYDADRDFLLELMQGSAVLNRAYYGFFLLDCFWAFVLLLVLWKFFYHQHRLQPKRFSLTRFRVFTILAITAYTFDLIENFHYAILFEHPRWVAQVKIAAYAAVFLLLADSFLRTVVKNFLGTLRRFMASSIYSLIILAIIGIFLPRASQVNSIVVDLYLQPWNMLILLVLSFTFAVSLTHYPSYINVDRNSRIWLITRQKFLGLLGIVYYKIKPEKGKDRARKKDGSYNYLLRLLGAMYFVGLFYMLSFTSQVNYDWPIRVGYVAAALMLVGAVVLYRLSTQKDIWYDYGYDLLGKYLPGFFDNDYTPREHRNVYLPEALQERKARSPYHLRPNDASWRRMLRLIHWPIAQFYALLVLTFLAHCGLFARLFSAGPGEGYSETNVLLSLVCIGLQFFAFIYYRPIRSLLRFSNYHPDLDYTVDAFVDWDKVDRLRQSDPIRAEALLRVQREQIRDFFRDHPCRMKGPFSLFSYLGFSTFSSNLGFLWTNFAIGAGIFLYLVFLNFDGSVLVQFGLLERGTGIFGDTFSRFSIRTNTILLILMYLFSYYGLFTLLTKNYIYYSQIRTRKSLLFVNSMLFLALVLGYSFYHTRMLGNNIYKLEPVPRDANREVSLREFAEGLDKEAPRYYVGCYGGGMKANAWTLSVLHELQAEQPDFMNRTLGISGASGGTMGWMNWSSILYAHDGNPAAWPEVIREISTENILSMDITHALGRDLFFYLFNPFQLDVGNRSEAAMDHYAHLTGNQQTHHSRVPFREFWRALYDQKKGRYPVLIANTTNVKGNHGMAVSVSTPDPVASRLLYQGADDILEITEWCPCSPLMTEEEVACMKPCAHTLSYYDAASTSNRFPLLSPAAKIETKGNYNDGGIYENSGLLSVFKLMEAISYHEGVESPAALRQENMFVNIVNDKDLYIRYYVMQNLGCEALRLKNYSELNSLLSSVAATEMLPTYIKAVLSNLDSLPSVPLRFRSVYLPHRFNVKEVKEIFGKELVCGGSPERIDARLHTLAEKNNRTIDSVLRIHLDRPVGRIPIVEPAVSRVMAEPAYQFMRAMLHHPETRRSIQGITQHR